MESLDPSGFGYLAYSLAVDIGFFRFESRGLELHPDRRPHRHFFPLELFRTAVMRIIVYSTPSCVYCRMLKDFLKNHDISYENKDVASDLPAQEEMIHKSHQMGVPVSDIDGEIFVGFNRAEIAKKLGIK